MQDVENIEITSDSQGCVLSVKVVPGASRDRLAGVLGDRLKITTSAPPEKGKANKAIAKLLAKKFSLSNSQVQLVAGTTSANKQFLLIGLEKPALTAILKGL